jgi:pimeloyl-ACP methyl ester carboxylesterase
MPFIAKVTRVLMLAALSVTTWSAAAQNIDIDKPLSIEKQGSFFVGGRDITSETLSTLPQADPKGTVTVEQMYVQYQVPVHPHSASVVFIHGCCLTGAEWETTPDGRMGWAEYFVRKGFPTYVVDQAARGRSAANATAVGAVKTGKLPPDALPAGFSVGREFAWTLFRFGPRYPQAYAGLQFPLEAQGEFWKQMVPDWAYSMSTPNPTVPSLELLSGRLKKTVLISHSQSGIYPFQAVAGGAAGVAAIVAVEPTACPAANLDAKPYAGIPILLLYGDFISQSPPWAAHYAECKAFAASVNAAGGHVDVIETTQLGMLGNSHMLMQDRNNLQIADVVTGWIKRNVH